MNKQADSIFRELERNHVELWRDIPDFTGLYQVSNLGRIKRLARQMRVEDIEVNLKEMMLNPFDSDKGEGRIYKRVRLTGHDGVVYNKYLHVLVAQAFIENYDTRMDVVNHIDNNRENNVVSNLEWCDQAHNVREYYRVHRRKPKNGPEKDSPEQ
jgi:hypothetical protein